MDMPNLTAGKDCLDFVSIVEAIIKRSCIIDYGIVQDTPADGIVTVSVAISDTPQNMFCMTCVLANIASSSLTVNVKPNKGDRVLVVYPRLYDESMFTVPDSEKDKLKIKVNPRAKGYNLLSGIAILINQYKTASHKNVINVADGKVDIKLAYDKQNDKNMLTFSSDKDGAIAFGNDKCDVKIDKDGYLSYKIRSQSDNKTMLEFKAQGMTMQDANGCKIETNDQFTVINGHLKVKK